MEDEIEPSHLCLDCRKDTRICVEPGNYYVLHNALWQTITAPQERLGMLCVACASERLGRPLMEDDFLTSPVQMVAWSLAVTVAEMTDEQKRRVMDTYEEHAAEYPDIQAELTAVMERLFTDH